MSQKRLDRLRKISRILDNQFEGPFGIRFGLDPLIGLIPVLGDALTTLISFSIVIESFLLGCSPAILLRMVLNIFLEDLVKLVPLIGQVFDFYWKSNLKNLALLEQHLQQPELAHKKTFNFFAILIFSFLAAFTSIIALSIYVFFWIAGFL